MAMATSSTSPRVCISVARPNDGEGIVRFQRRLSAGARRSGLLSAETGLSVIARDRDAGVIVGQAVIVPALEGLADFAVAVADAYEEYQVGSHLLERAMTEAPRHDIQVFRIDALAHNHRMIDVFTWHGFVPLGNDFERLYLALDGSGLCLMAPEPAGDRVP
jgi:N-acetylglutamate synthase-like GNAT family acetyltransferase